MVRSALLESAVALRGRLRSRHQIAAALMSEAAFADGSTDRSLTRTYNRRSAGITCRHPPTPTRKPHSPLVPDRQQRHRQSGRKVKVRSSSAVGRTRQQSCPS